MSMNGEDTLDSLIPQSSTTQPTTDISITHLSYPSFDTDTDKPSASDSPSQQVLKDRIYIGNLHPSVDEYALLQVFSKFGKVTKLDFLFHKSGPLKGKPRGYAFVEYANEHDAQNALLMAHDKLLRGRKIVVTYAHHAPADLAGGSTGGKGRRSMMEIGRPTTLSLLKSGVTSKPMATEAKIARMEAKLRQMETTNATGEPRAAPLHPSLPQKPPPPLPVELQQQQRHPSSSGAQGSSRPMRMPSRTGLPPIPMTLPSSSSTSHLKMGALGSSAMLNPPPTIAAAKPSRQKLIGVKIKPKEKDPASTPPAPSKSD